MEGADAGITLSTIPGILEAETSSSSDVSDDESDDEVISIEEEFIRMIM